MTRANMSKYEATRPDEPFDEGLQHERTTLAWERTAFSLIVVAALITRYSIEDGFNIEAALGSLGILVGTITMLWSGYKYDRLHGPLQAGESPVHPAAAWIMGVATIIGATLALYEAIHLVIQRHS